jgi:hypothetical protein
MHIKFTLYIALLSYCLLNNSCSDNPSSNEKTDVTPTANTVDSVVNLPVTAHPVAKRVADSIFNGPYTERYSSGIIFKSGYFSSGLEEGIWRVFYENGKLWSEGEYRKGVRNGHGVTYDSEGNKTSEGEYLNGHRKGKWTYWINGIKKEIDYK